MKKLFLILFILFSVISYGQTPMSINGVGLINAHINGTGTKVKINDVSNDIPFDTTGATHKIVRVGGTIGVNCDYTTITGALAAITDNSISNQYILDVKNGTYNELGSFDGGFGFYVGITLKHYIHIIGESEAGVIVYGPAAPTQPDEVLVDVFHIPATCLIQNMTIIAYNNKYAFHCDYNSGGYMYDLYVKNCNVEHSGSRTGYNDAIGCGMYGGQSVNVFGCTIVGEGFYAHGDISCAGRDLSKHFNIYIKNSTMNNFIWQDYLEYSANRILLYGNTIGVVNLQTITSVYDANPGNPACNTGTMIYTAYSVGRNIVTTVTRDATTVTILGSSLSTPTDFY